eukprot:scaffold107325_cov55-Prasinocladus_malaysianus.AAC.2
MKATIYMRAKPRDSVTCYQLEAATSALIKCDNKTRFTNAQRSHEADRHRNESHAISVPCA